MSFEIMKHVFTLLFIACLFMGLSLYFGNSCLIELEDAQPSSIMKVDNLDIVQNAKRLPTNGPNFETYSRILSTIGRTHVHSQLRPVILDAYQSLERTAPQVKWIYAESGWKNGGRFWPHRTHRNGLSVDFIVPVIDKKTLGSTTLFLWPLNAWGYRTRFDAEGIHNGVQIDFPAMILHLKALEDACAKHGLSIKRVIFDPPLLALLRKDRNFSSIASIAFMQGAAWHPHDSHYHVDFRIDNVKLARYHL
jgi:penicillin-insensitive murein endopeptidase